MNVSDLGGLEEDARRNRQLGYTGAAVIHPSHVPIMNRVFSPTAEELDRYRRIVAAYDSQSALGHGAIEFEGDMLDEAMVRTARQFLGGHR